MCKSVQVMSVIEKLNIILKDATATKFKRIKQALGLESNTETIRMIINWYYEQHREEIEKAIEGPQSTCGIST